MNSAHKVLALALIVIDAASALASGPAAAQALGAVGQILQMGGGAPTDVVILRKAGAIQPAHAYDWLMPGDRIQVRAADAAATVYDIAAHHSVRITSADGPKAVGGASPGRYSEAADAFFQGFNSLFNNPRRPIAVETQTRGVSAFLPPFADPLLTPGVQTLPRGQAGVAVFWRGGGGDVTLSQADGRVLAQSAKGVSRSAVLASEPLAGDYLLTAGPRLKWSVTTVDPDAIPEPPWMSGERSTSEAERVVRAAWILWEGPPQWRLFATSELAMLSDENYAASQLWQALQTGDFAAAGGPAAP